MLLRLLRNLPAAAAALFGVAGLWVAVQAWQENAALRAYERAMSEVEVIPPAGFPAQDQESVEIAKVLYSINIPVSVEGPSYDATLSDRGLTTGGLILPQKKVTVGPAAFSSWAVLGSTLAHEIEVHVEQSFFLVVARDHFSRLQIEARRRLAKVFPAVAPTAAELFENDGTWKAERDAYMHEIRNAKRFGLSQEEVASIWRVMDYFYPTNHPQSSDPQLSASSESKTEAHNSEAISSSEL
jgi:hypothetical protein